MAHATNGYAAKRAVMRALAARAAQPGNPLSNRQVQYKLRPATMEQVCIYGGAFSFEHPEDQAVVDGNKDTIPFEQLLLAVHVRVAESPPPDDPEEVDILAETIGDEIASVIARNPNVCGGNSVARIAAGEGDYSPTEAEEQATLSVRIAIESYVT